MMKQELHVVLSRTRRKSTIHQRNLFLIHYDKSFDSLAFRVMTSYETNNPLWFISRRVFFVKIVNAVRELTKRRKST